MRAVTEDGISALDMARSFSIVFTLMLGIVLIGGVVLWWAGPTLTHLALLEPRRDEPLQLVDFARGPEPAVYDARYRAPLAALVASEGGAVGDSYELVHLLAGRRNDEWRYLYRLNIGRARDLVQIMTATPYSMMFDNLPQLEHQMLASFAQPAARWRDTLVLWRLRYNGFPDSDSEAESAAAGRPGDPMFPVLELMDLGDGGVVWDAPILHMETVVAAGGASGAGGADDASSGAERMVVMDFATSKDALDWLRSTDVITARALTNARVQNLSVSVYRLR